MTNKKMNRDIVIVHSNDHVVIPAGQKSLSEIRKINVGVTFGISEAQQKKNNPKNETKTGIHKKSKKSNKNPKYTKDFMLCFGERANGRINRFKRVLKNQKRRFSYPNSQTSSMAERTGPTWYCVIFIVKLKFAWASSRAIKLFEEWKYD